MLFMKDKKVGGPRVSAVTAEPRDSNKSSNSLVIYPHQTITYFSLADVKELGLGHEEGEEEKKKISKRQEGEEETKFSDET